MFRITVALILGSALAFGRVALAAVPLYGQCGGSGWTGETSCRALQRIRHHHDFACVRRVHLLPTARVITGSFDGKMVKYDRKGSSGACEEQTETGEEDAVFILESGASISNVIIGQDQAEGIHCRGPCTVTNVWWEDVCERLDAITIKQTGSGDVSTINGGGAFNAEDKIAQRCRRVVISNFFASNFGKLYRACGNCETSHERHVTVNNVCLKSGSEGVGINSNFGDTATLSNVKTNGKPSSTNVCCTYKGVGKGSEPPKIGCGDSQSACQYTASLVGSC
ncbi:pectate lyase-domain-containing protein [Cyathus striatus]|nr:pectate lyase-domain-containing protein [Cyathus striatus]